LENTLGRAESSSKPIKASLFRGKILSFSRTVQPA
jgi:hypothetical protein